MNFRRKASLWRRAARLAGARLFHWAENNRDADFAKNGEQWLLEQLFAEWAVQPKRNRVVFDVGANLGKHSDEVLRLSHKLGVPTEIHAFEPGAAARDALIRRFASESSGTIVGAAVGERAGRMHLYFDSPGSSHASLINRMQVTDGRGEEVEVIRLADYVQAHRIPRIDLLKLDVQGAESAALVGTGELLRPNLIPVIQFEYGGATLDGGRRLRDFFDFLKSRKYLITNLFHGSLELRKFKPWMDHFRYANYVAILPGYLDASSE
jgi:FkbM family methyltransferase